MKIGNVRLANQVVAAPMAGVTDRAFRTLAAEAGCSLVFTEMVSDQALLYNNPRTGLILDIDGEPDPLGVQIFGSDPSYMEQAAIIVAGRGASIVDINMGCPTPKIVKNGEGSALLKNPGLAYRIVSGVVKAAGVPVTVKIRKGWDRDSVNAVEMAKILEEAGASAITVHGRTRDQFFSGEADWEIIGEVRRSVSIPVIGNGDVRTPEDARRMLCETGCDAVMVGRAAMGNPWLFKDTVHYLATGERLPAPTPEEKVTVALRHLDLMIASKGEYIAVREMRKHASWYVRGLPGAARVRQALYAAVSADELRNILCSCVGSNGV